VGTLFFIRHAETEQAGRFCGHLDPPINEKGRRQIEQLLESLKDEIIHAAYSSDLARSICTAQAVGTAFGLSPVVLPDLREIGFGEWEGMSWQEIESRYPDYARRWSEKYPTLPAPGGEEFTSFQSRVLRRVEAIVAEAGPENAAVITHAGVMRVVLRSLCGFDEEQAWERTRNYCAVFRYQPGSRA
jgi:broad specificity phosphatase PhoE